MRRVRGPRHALCCADMVDTTSGAVGAIGAGLNQIGSMKFGDTLKQLGSSTRVIAVDASDDASNVEADSNLPRNAAIQWLADAAQIPNEGDDALGERTAQQGGGALVDGSRVEGAPADPGPPS